MSIASDTISGATTGAMVGGVPGAVIGGAVGLLGSAYSAYKTSQLNKSRQDLLNQRRNELGNWYNTEYNKNILDTDYSKAMTTQMEKGANEQNKRIASNNAIMGGTDEAAIAQKANLNNQIGNTYNNIAATGEQRKQGIRREFIGRQSQLDSGQSNIWDKQAENWQNMTSNLNQAANTAGGYFGGRSRDSITAEGAANTPPSSIGMQSDSATNPATSLGSLNPLPALQ